MRVVLGDLRKAPWTLLAYVGFVVLTLPVGLVLWTPDISAGIWLALGFGLVIVGVIYVFMLRGGKIAWGFVVACSVWGLVDSVIGADPWYRFPEQLVALGLLLAPPSRRYVFPPKAPPPADGNAWSPIAQDDDTRPRGWYFDPADATRMRYWDADLGGWQSKTTRAPRTLRP